MPRAQIALLGEAKATIRPPGTTDLERLDHLRDLLASQGHQAHAATLALFSLHGFQPNLARAAARRADVLLVDLGVLYGNRTAHATPEART